MRLLDHYTLEQDDDEYIFVIHFHNTYEFSQELDNDEEEGESFVQQVKEFITTQFPNLKITTIKIMIGATLISTFGVTQVAAQEATTTNYTNYVVKSGDSLWTIATHYGISVQQLKDLNHLTSDMLYVGQNLKIPNAANEEVKLIVNGDRIDTARPVIINNTTYLPIRAFGEAIGASVWFNSESHTVGINKGDMRIAFIIGSSIARVNGEQVSTSPSRMINGTTYVPIRFVSQTLGYGVNWDGTTKTVTIDAPTNKYTVKAGDSLWSIANDHHTTINAIKKANGFTSDVIYPGQELIIPTRTAVAPKEPTYTAPPVDEGNYTKPTVTYTTHVVEQGDNAWNLSIKYGIPMAELLEANYLTMDSTLSLGQELTIPVHHIPVKPVVDAKHGELLDWWTEAQYVFSIGKTAKVTDFQTGRSFYVKRTIGANHSDTEPLTAKDAAIIKDIWGGEYSWDKRAVIVEVDGRRLAASMASMPHSIQFIYDNNFDGHFDIHFLNSTRHKDGQITEAHQEQVRIAAGVSQQ